MKKRLITFAALLFAFLTAFSQPGNKAVDFYKKAEAFAAQNKFVEALDNYKKATEANPNYVEAYMSAAKTFTRISMQADAIFCYRKALKIAPNSCDVNITVGNFYKETRQKADSAFIYYSKAQQLKCDTSKELLFNIGWYYNDKKNYAASYAPLKKALQIDSVYKSAISEISYSYRITEQYNEGIQYFREQYDLSKFDLYLYYIGLFHLQQKDKVKATGVYEELKALDSKLTAGLKKRIDALP